MAKPKATTLQQKFGFADGELSTPLHDEIMLWLDTYILEAVSIAADIPIEPSDWEEVFLARPGERFSRVSLEEACVVARNEADLHLEGLRHGLDRAERRLRGEKIPANYLNGVLDDMGEAYYAKVIESTRKEIDRAEGWTVDCGRRKPPEIIGKTWEYAIGTSNKFIVGFVDMLATYREFSLSLHIFADRAPSFEVNSDIKTMAFEVKPKIPSLGELIRQIRMYQSYINCPFCVVSPDDRFKDALVSQGIKFLKYTG